MCGRIGRQNGLMHKDRRELKFPVVTLPQRGQHKDTGLPPVSIGLSCCHAQRHLTRRERRRGAGQVYRVNREKWPLHGEAMRIHVQEPFLLHIPNEPLCRLHLLPRQFLLPHGTQGVQPRRGGRQPEPAAETVRPRAKIGTEKELCIHLTRPFSTTLRIEGGPHAASRWTWPKQPHPLPAPRTRRISGRTLRPS